MNLKKFLNKLCGYDRKQNLALGIVGAVTFCICFPVMFLTKVVEQKANYNVIAEEALFNSFIYGNEGIYVVLGILAVVNGMILFSYLHSREKMDFYFGLPVSRTNLFWRGYLQGILNMIIPYLLNLLLLILAGMTASCISADALLTIAAMLVLHTLFYLAMFSLTVFAVILTGKKLYAILGTVTLLVYFPAYNILYDAVVYQFREQLNVIREGCFYLSPITIMVLFFSKMQESLHAVEGIGVSLLFQHWNFLLALAIMGAVLTFASLKMYQIRKSESVGKAIVFPVAKRIIKIALYLIFLVAFFWFLPRRLFGPVLTYQVVSLLVGIPITQLVVDSLLEQQWKTFLCAGKRTALYLGISILCVVGTRFLDYNLQYHGFENLPDANTYEALLNHHCVINEYGEAVKGNEYWEKFLNDVSLGVEGKVRIATVAAEHLTYRDVYYKNGKYYCFENDNLYRREVYKYMLDIPSKENEYIQVVLTNDQNFTLDGKSTEPFIHILTEQV